MTSSIIRNAKRRGALLGTSSTPDGDGRASALPLAWRRRSDQRGGEDGDGGLSAVAEFGRDLLIERAQSYLARAKAEGATLGRPLTAAQRANALQRVAAGELVAQRARDYRTSRMTIMRIREKAETLGNIEDGVFA